MLQSRQLFCRNSEYQFMEEYSIQELFCQENCKKITESQTDKLFSYLLFKTSDRVSHSYKLRLQHL